MKPALTAAIATALLCAGCAGAPVRPASAPGGATTCLLHAGSAAGMVSGEIDLPGTVRPDSAPVPTSPAERILFRNLYKCLAEVACDGAVGAGLAAELRAGSEGRVWSVRLAEGARWPDGSPLRARDVREAWRRARRRAPDAAPWFWIDPESVEVGDRRVLQVPLRRPLGDHAALFAHPALAVAGDGGASELPSAPGRRPRTPERTGSSGWRLVPDGGAALDFRVFPAMDERDLLDQAAGATVVRQRRALSYADRLPDRRIVALPADRVYALVWPVASGTSGDAAALRRRLPVASFPEDVAVVADLPWGGRRAPCPPAPADPGAAEAPPAVLTRIVFESGDPGARALAEAVVAWATGTGAPAGGGAVRTASPDLRIGAGFRVLALDRRAIPGALEGGDAAAIWRIDAEFGDPCLDRAAAEFALGGEAGGFHLAPLLAGNASLVLPPGWGAVAVDGCGIPLFDAAFAGGDAP